MKKSIKIILIIFLLFTSKNANAYELYGWGNNSSYQLGIGGFFIPKIISSPWVMVAVGESHSLGIREDGTLWGWGSNVSGQLGLEPDALTNSFTAVPIQLGNSSDWKTVSCGQKFSFAIKKDGSLWSWGDNQFGQLGQGTKETNVFKPTQITRAAAVWQMVSCGYNFAVALNDKGELWSCGFGLWGQLGVNNNNNIDTLKKVEFNNYIEPNVKIKFVSCGLNHAVAISQKDSLYGWGSNDLGQLGIKTNKQSLYIPKLIPFFNSTGKYIFCDTVVCSGNVTIVIDKSRKLYGAGINKYGQLGTGDTLNRDSLSLVVTGKLWKTVSSGYHFTTAIATDNTLWAWGRNETKYLGNGKDINSKTPIQIGTDQNWNMLFSKAYLEESGGDFHLEKEGTYTANTFAIKIDKSLWSWGDNTNANLGLIKTSPAPTPSPVGIPILWSKISAGYSHNIGISSLGKLWSWGNNDKGQLGNGTFTENLTPVQVGDTSLSYISASAGYNFSLAISNNNNLYSSGSNNLGQLGLKDNTDRNTFQLVNSTIGWSAVACGSSHALGIKTDGSLWSWGLNSKGQLGDDSLKNRLEPSPIAVGSKWLKIAASYANSAGIKDDNSLWAWGSNDSKQLGDIPDNKKPNLMGNPSWKWIYVAAGGESETKGFFAAIKKDSTLWMWGINDKGQLGTGDNNNAKEPIQIGTDKDWASVYCGYSFTIAIKKDGSLYAWGNNNSGQFGNGVRIDSKNPVKIGTGFTVASAGNSHSLAIKTDGTIFAWGDNKNGKIGVGSSSLRNSTPILIDGANDWTLISAGSSFSAAIKGDGSLSTFGTLKENSTGKIIIDNDKPQAINNDKDWVNVSSGFNHIAAIKTNGTLWSWGLNDFGQIGNNTITIAQSPVKLDSIWINVSCGEFFTVGVQSNGTLWAWGKNDNGQLGTSNKISSIKPVQVGSSSNWVQVSCGLNHAASINNLGELYSWGNNDFGQLGNGDITGSTKPIKIGGNDWIYVNCGANYTVAVKSDGNIYTWGFNNVGQLGNNNNNETHSPQNINLVANGPFVSSSISEAPHTLAIDSQGKLFSWGSSRSGKLGLGDKNFSTSFFNSPKQVGSDNKWSWVSCGDSFSLALKGRGYILSPPVLIAPANNQIGVAIDTMITWNRVPIAVNYRVQVSEDQTFATTLSNTLEFLTFKSLKTLPLKNLHSYYWRVMAINGLDKSDWSEIRKFTVKSSLAKPILASPPNGASSTPLSPTLDWNTVAGATGYRLQVSKDNSFATASEFIKTNTTKNLTGLIVSNTYYWRVKAFKDFVDSSEYSDIWNFTTSNIDGRVLDFNPKTYCAGESITVPFELSGFKTDNVVKLELSDKDGNFSSTPTLLNSQQINTNGQISGILPANSMGSQNYKVRISTSNPANIFSNQSAITINELPNAVISGNNIECISNPTTFSAQAGYNKYEWSLADNTFGSLNSNQNSTVISWSKTGKSKVLLKITTLAGCSKDSSFDIEVKAKPNPTIKGNNQVCLNTPESYNTDIKPDYTYKWSIQDVSFGTIINGNNTANPTVVWLKSGSTKLILDVSDTTSDCSNQITYDVAISRSPVISNLTRDTSLCIDSKILLNPKVTDGSGNYTYSWTTDNNFPITNPAETFIEVSPKVKTVFYLQVKDKSGCIGFDTVNVNIVPKPNPTISSDSAFTTIQGDIYKYWTSHDPDYTVKWVVTSNDGVIINSVDYQDTVRVKWNESNTSFNLKLIKSNKYCGQYTADSIVKLKGNPNLTGKFKLTLLNNNQPVGNSITFGDTIDLEITSQSIPINANIQDVRAEIKYSAGVLVPFPLSTAKNIFKENDKMYRKDTVVLSYNLSIQNILSKSKFIATLGNTDTLELFINVIAQDSSRLRLSKDSLKIFVKTCNNETNQKRFINSFQSSLGISSVYPNPGNTSVEVIVNYDMTGEYEFSIVDIKGLKQKSFIVRTDKPSDLITIDLTGIETGNYYLQVKSKQNKATEVLKVIR